MSLRPDLAILSDVNGRDIPVLSSQPRDGFPAGPSDAHSNGSGQCRVREIVQAQRLLRRLCNECKQPIEVPKELWEELGITDDDVIYGPVGCPKCNGTGKKGRTGAYEVMLMTQGTRQVILNGGNTEDIRQQALKDGMLTLRMDAILKMKQGIVDYEEVIRETM